MRERKLAVRGEDVKEVSFAEGLKKIAGRKLIGKLSDEEKAQFERNRFAEEESKRKSFVLGKQFN